MNVLFLLWLQRHQEFIISENVCVSDMYILFRKCVAAGAVLHFFAGKEGKGHVTIISDMHHIHLITIDTRTTISQPFLFAVIKPQG